MNESLDAKITMEYMKVFTSFFSKLTKKERTRLFTVTLQFPLNILINISELMDDDMVLPGGLPYVFIRHMRPWEKHKDKWGNIPIKDFVELIQQEYESQEFKEGLTMYEIDREEIR